ncbi:McrC family protein, partial [Rhodobacteraceae bacterium]|nr:McrC family protein [Paracoccaceae bacterium]
LIDRFEKFEASRAATGAIDPVSTVKRLKTGSDMPVVSKRKARSTNISENRLISVALQRALPVLSDGEQATLSPIVSKWLGKFPTSKVVWRDLEDVERGLARNRYGGPRGYYQNALVGALIILGASGLSLSGSETTTADAVLLNTADVFEKYLRNTLSNHYSKRGLLVTKAGLEKTSLYINGSFSLEPDIVIYKEERLVLLCDAKYKIPTAADHYQMHTYLRRFRVKSGLLLCPNFESNHVEENVLQSPDGACVREIYLPMGDLEMAEDCLVNLVERYSL